MSSPASSEVVVTFDNHQNAFQAWVAFSAWSDKANNSELEGEDEGDFSITTTFIGQKANGFNFSVESSKLANCQWQLERILNWFKGQKGLLKFEAPVLACVEGTFWEKEVDAVPKGE